MAHAAPCGNGSFGGSNAMPPWIGDSSSGWAISPLPWSHMKAAISPTGGLATGGTPSTVRAAAATGGLGVRLSTTVIGTARAGGFIGPAPQLRQDSTAREGRLASADWGVRATPALSSPALLAGIHVFTSSQHYEDVNG